MMSFDTLNSIVIYLWITLGSGVGGVLRYALTLWMLRVAGPAFPWGTLLVNILGCTLIGWFATMTGADGRMLVTPRTRQFVMTGICGGFTTFSSFSLETLNLLRQGETARALAYVGLSVGVCLLGVWGGHWLATAMQR